MRYALPSAPSCFPKSLFSKSRAAVEWGWTSLVNWLLERSETVGGPHFRASYSLETLNPITGASLSGFSKTIIAMISCFGMYSLTQCPSKALG